MAEIFQKATPQTLADFQKKAEEMKKKVLAAANPSPGDFTGKCYYFSSKGDDANDGLSPEKALKNLAMVEKLPLERGDAVLFRRGELFRGMVNCRTPGITFSAWGEGEKPTLCGSLRNYADPELWEKSHIPGVWLCKLSFHNVGIITLDHDPRTVGKYDALLGVSMPHEPGMEPIPCHLKNDLEFCSDLDTDKLYFKSEENPGSRFQRIEIGAQNHLLCFRGNEQEDLTVDNLHITVIGSHGISFLTNKRGRVKNCVIDYIGGSVIWRAFTKGPNPRYNVRFGNAVEVYGGCSDFKVWNNWIYQIYDTGITHQYHWNMEYACTQEDVEYFDNLIEYCYWSIEYYNTDTKYSITRNIHVHDNFCRFGGTGWGCPPARFRTSPMYSFMGKADETENYVTEKNIFQFTYGIIYKHSPEIAPEGSLIFRDNTYIQYAGEQFALWDNKEIPFTEEAVSDFLKNTLKEESYSIFEAEKEE